MACGRANPEVSDGERVTHFAWTAQLGDLTEPSMRGCHSPHEGGLWHYGGGPDDRAGGHGAKWVLATTAQGSDLYHLKI